MGGLARKTPFTFWTFLIGALHSRRHPSDHGGLLQQGPDPGACLAVRRCRARSSGSLGIAGVFVTSVYIFRLLFIVFGGARRGRAAGTATDRPRPRARGTGARRAGRHAGGRHHGDPAGAPRPALPRRRVPRVAAGPGRHAVPVELPPHDPPRGGNAGAVHPARSGCMQVLSEAASLLGIPAAWLLVRRERRAVAAAAPAPAARRFLEGGWGFDWVYDRALVRPFVWLARVNSRDIVDRVARWHGRVEHAPVQGFRWTQNGRVRWYAAGARGGRGPDRRRGGAAMILVFFVAVPLVLGFVGWALGRRQHCSAAGGWRWPPTPSTSSSAPSSGSGQRARRSTAGQRGRKPRGWWRCSGPGSRASESRSRSAWTGSPWRCSR